MNYRPYTCSETCGQEKHCGNRYCSAHPRYFGPKTKKSKTQKEGRTPFQKKRYNRRSPLPF